MGVGKEVVFAKEWSYDGEGVLPPGLPRLAYLREAVQRPTVFGYRPSNSVWSLNIFSHSTLLNVA